MSPEIRKKPKGFALPLILIVLIGVASFFIQIIFNKGKKKDDCNYSIVLSPAEIIRADTVSAGYCELYFAVVREGKTDTITYSSEFGGYASFEQMKNKQVVVGAKFQYAVKKLNSGACPPLVEVLILEKYSN